MKLFLLLTFFFCTSVLAQGKPYTVFLREGAILTNINDRSETKLAKGIYARVIERDPRKNDVYYVFNNEGKILYMVSSLDIVEIKKDYQLLPAVDASVVYPPKSVFKTENKFALFDTQMNLHVENMQLSDLNNIYQDEISNVTSTRYEVRTLYHSTFLVDFGFSLNYQSVTWKNEIETVKLSILSVGPHFRHDFLTNDDFTASIEGGAELAPVYEGRSPNSVDKYSASLLDLGIEGVWQTRFGLLSLGSHYRRHNISLSETGRTNLKVTPTELTLTSIGVMAGYKLEWEL